LPNLVNAKNALTAEMALRLAKAVGVTMDLLPRIQAGHDAAQSDFQVNRRTLSY
jgi:plasmid maintenance system antidote protein VapI